jgi:two-component system NtrC family sensor kinase
MTTMDQVFSSVLQLLHKDLLLVDSSGAIYAATGIFSEVKTGRFLSELMPGVVSAAAEHSTAFCGPVQLDQIGPMFYQVIRLTDSDFSGYCLIFKAVTEPHLLQQKTEQMQQLLFQSEKMAVIGQLTTSVTHEINNPIGYVHSNLLTLSEYCESLMKLIEVQSELLPAESTAQLWQKFDFEYIREDISNLLNESNFGLEQVKSQIRSLKSLSHTDDGQFQLADLEAGILSSLTIVNNELKYKAVIHKEFAALPLVECIPSQLNQVMLNLLVNAGQAISGQGEIYIRTGVEGNGVWVEIQDNGCGISDEDLPRIFEPFFTTKEIGKGTGLGLALSLNTIKRHHGRIEVVTKPGEGSSFKVWLPVLQPVVRAEA